MSWNKGKKLSDEHKLKVSNALRGREHSDEHNYKVSLSKMGSKNAMWKDKVGRAGIHEWVRRHLPKPQFCVSCNRVPPYDLTNISGKYLRDLTDWQWLCRKCHMLSDGRMNNLTTCGKPIDMSGRICCICGNDKTYIKSNGRPHWYRLNGKPLCKVCYDR